MNEKYRIGNSIDIHPLVIGAPLYIGGVLIPSKKGSISHSDGDALMHAVVESILGALNKGDLGMSFPDTDEKTTGISSTFFLNEVKKILNDEGYKINNIDIMIVLEEPKLGKYKKLVCENLSSLLGIKINQINIKAGTNEKIASIGNNDSYLVWCTTLIEKI